MHLKLFVYSSSGWCVYALRCVLACLTVCIHMHVCVSGHVSASSLLVDATGAIYDSGGTRYWPGTRRVGEKGNGGGVNPGGSRDNPQACYQRGRVMGCVCRCLRHLELEPQGPHIAAAGVSECRHPLQWCKSVIAMCMCVCI